MTSSVPLKVTEEGTCLRACNLRYPRVKSMYREVWTPHRFGQLYPTPEWKKNHTTCCFMFSYASGMLPEIAAKFDASKAKTKASSEDDDTIKESVQLRFTAIIKNTRVKLFFQGLR